MSHVKVSLSSASYEATGSAFFVRCEDNAFDSLDYPFPLEA